MPDADLDGFGTGNWQSGTISVMQGQPPA